MIVSDKAYQEASRKTAKLSENRVRRRFRQVHGEEGDRVLNEMAERMEQNIRSDNSES